MGKWRAKVPTPIQVRLAEYIEAYWKEHGFGPTHKEMMMHFGWTSWATPNEHINRLAELGVVAHDKFVPRSVRLIGQLMPTSLQQIMMAADAVVSEYRNNGDPRIRALADALYRLKTEGDGNASGATGTDGTGKKD